MRFWVHQQSAVAARRALSNWHCVYHLGFIVNDEKIPRRRSYKIKVIDANSDGGPLSFLEQVDWSEHKIIQGYVVEPAKFWYDWT